MNVAKKITIAQRDEPAGEILNRSMIAKRRAISAIAGRVATEEVGDQRIRRGGEDEAHRDRQHEGDDLVAGQRRHRRADRQERAGDQQGAEIARRDHAHVRIAEVTNRQHDRERQRQRDRAKCPCREELANAPPGPG